MEDQKDRFGEKMRLVERAKEDIYFAEKDRELIENLKARLKKVERSQGQEQQVGCPIDRLLARREETLLYPDSEHHDRA